MTMDVKELRVDPALDGRTDHYVPDAVGSLSHAAKRNKTYHEVMSSPAPKVDVQIARPCAVIGPDRIIPQQNFENENHSKKSNSEEWAFPSNGYRWPHDYPSKANDQQDLRNISPRQTFQENMQRVMVPRFSPTSNREVISSSDLTARDISSKSMKMKIPSETRYCEVPYPVNVMNSEQKNLVRNPDSISNMNPLVMRSTTQGWPPTAGVPLHSRPYAGPDLYRYPDYASNVSPRSVPIIRPPPSRYDDARAYSESFYRAPNIRYEPYPSSKDRFPQGRFDYINNYTSPYAHFPPHKSHPYYPHVPMKYADPHKAEQLAEAYHRQSYQPPLNLPYQNLPINYSAGQGNCVQTKSYTYPGNSLHKQPSRVSYDPNKISPEYDLPVKSVAFYDNYYFHDVSRMNSPKGPVIMSKYSNVHPLPPNGSQFYRTDSSSKPYEYPSLYKQSENTLNRANSFSRVGSQFSPNMISPVDSTASNDTVHTHGTSQEDCGYVSQCSTTSAKSTEFGTNKNFYYNPHKRYEFVNGTLGSFPPLCERINPNIVKNRGNEKKNLDVRQFLQMWNEGDEEHNEYNNKPKLLSEKSNVSSKHYEMIQNPDELYVLGLVNVPSEELGKYEHIQKVSKLPDNIKGYSSLELLNQFEEAIQNSNKSIHNQREKNNSKNTGIHKPDINKYSGPPSPLDVEAKISQSVIHKEVGCNFEIKPCSPKMLNVEMAAPAQPLLVERTIEKISNTLNLKPTVDNVSKYRESDKYIIPERSIPSCTLNKNTFIKDKNISQNKNYTLQDLESMSGVCLASLPRLDNDCMELNFPEVNQQFINANKMEPEHIPTTLNDTEKNISNISCGVSKSCIEGEQNPIYKENSPNPSRKTKANLKEFYQDPLSPNQRKSSVIIKNSENRHNIMENNDNKTNEKATPMNLSFCNKRQNLNNFSLNTTNDCTNSPQSSIPVQLNAENKHKSGNFAINLSKNSPFPSSNKISNSKISIKSSKRNSIKPRDKSLKNSLNIYSEDNNVSNEIKPLKEISESLHNSITNTDKDNYETQDINEATNTLINEMTMENKSILQPKESSNNNRLNDVEVISKEINFIFDHSNSDHTSNCIPGASIKMINKVEHFIGVLEEYETYEQSSKPKNFNIDNTVEKSKHKLNSCIDKGVPLVNNINDIEHNLLGDDSVHAQIGEKYKTCIKDACDDKQMCSKKIGSDSSKSYQETFVEENVNDQDFKLKDLVVFQNKKNSNECLKISNETQTLQLGLNSHSEIKLQTNTDYEISNNDITSPIQSVGENDFIGNETLEVDKVSSSKAIICNINKDSSAEEIKSSFADAFYKTNRMEVNVQEFESYIPCRNKNIFKQDIEKKQPFNKKMFCIAIQNLILFQTGLCKKQRFPQIEENIATNIMRSENHPIETVYNIKAYDVMTKCCSENIFESKQYLHRLCKYWSKTPKSKSIISDIKLKYSIDIDYRRCCSEELLSTTKKNLNFLAKSANSVNNYILSVDTKPLRQILHNDSTKSPINKNNEMDGSAIIKPNENNVPKRRTLKRSRSESSLLATQSELRNTSNVFEWAIKRRKLELNCEVDTDDNNVLFNRRNSMSSVLYDEENVSYCILIDDSIILEEGNSSIENDVFQTDHLIIENDDDNIIPTYCDQNNVQIAYIELENDIHNLENSIDIDESAKNLLDVHENSFEVSESLDNVVSLENSENIVHVGENSDVMENEWLEDVGCVETVVGEDIDEDSNGADAVVVSEKTENLSNFENSEDNNNLSINAHATEIKNIYGNIMCNDNMNVVETLYRTPQMNVNYKLYQKDNINNKNQQPTNNISNQEIISSNETTKQVLPRLTDKSNTLDEKCLSILSSVKSEDDSIPESTLDNYILPSLESLTKITPMLSEIAIAPDEPIPRVNTIDTEFNFLPKLEDFTFNRIWEDSENVHETFDSEEKRKVEKNKLTKKRSSEESNSCTTDSEKKSSNIFKTLMSNSKSPEVTSTSEGKKSGIYLKITNYKGSRVSVIEEKPDKKLRCKFTEANNYVNPHDSEIRPLITKAAQKYIPPPKEIHDLKIKLTLPKHSLLKLRELKSAKEKPKCANLKNGNNSISKKIKPNFEDVLKNIDESQLKLQKCKTKKSKSSVPKVVIKKTGNGSHYASTSDTDFNPDLTGRKWQPWVFLEKNPFVDKMALRNKKKAIYCFKTNTYVLLQKIQNHENKAHSEKHSNIEYCKSKPKQESSPHTPLKYTIRLKQSY